MYVYMSMCVSTHTHTHTHTHTYIHIHKRESRTVQSPRNNTKLNSKREGYRLGFNELEANGLDRYVCSENSKYI